MDERVRNLEFELSEWEESLRAAKAIGLVGGSAQKYITLIKERLRKARQDQVSQRKSTGEWGVSPTKGEEDAAN